MMKKLTVAVVCPFIIALASCGGGGGGSSSNNNTTPTEHTGVLVDSSVSNVSYQTMPSGHSGITNANGEYTYENGDTVIFSIGNLEFPEVTAGDTISPLTLAGATTITDQQATNIARLFQTLDDDGDPSNGINIDAAAIASANMIDFDVDATTFENDPNVVNLVANSGSTNTSLVSEAEAQAHLSETLFNSSGTVAGTWQSEFGDGKLILRADNTFSYFENGPLTPAPYNGMETGTYVYDAGAGNITFTIETDTNGPGNQSGLGDIGTPAVIDVVLANSNNTMTLSDNTGSLTVNRTSQVVGAWGSTAPNCTFCYLVLLADGTFLYAENDSTASAPENGLEVGTYTYSPTTGNISFNISYDDNGPGSDSGVGDIGAPAVIGANLSADNTTLTVAGGVLNLSALNFVSNDAITGVWSYSSGAAFNHLVLLADGTFIYAENDLQAQAPENGLEVGTYTYDPNTGNISFNITYDDNDPGNDSGVGDIGTPVVINSSYNNHTLTIAGGALVLTKKL